MLTFSQARRLAETWLEVVADGKVELELIREATIAKRYGWVFFYQSSAFLRDPEDFSHAPVGNAPFIIERFDVEIKRLPTGGSPEEHISDYERSIPAARLQMRAEEPIWS